jgi:predicted nucleotidyltransferase
LPPPEAQVMAPDDPLLKRCAEAIREAYPGRLAGIVLYGSVARGDDTPESDIDLLVLIEGEYDLWEEIGRLVDATYDLQLESGKLISAKPTRAEDYRRGATMLYRNAIEEGVAL